MISKHTPGPWDMDEGDYGIYQIETSDQIAEVFSHHPDEELKANARLIAAAPELLEALRELLEYDGGAFCVCDDPYAMDRARAAIAKAEGR